MDQEIIGKLKTSHISLCEMHGESDPQWLLISNSLKPVARPSVRSSSKITFGLEGP